MNVWLGAKARGVHANGLPIDNGAPAERDPRGILHPDAINPVPLFDEKGPVDPRSVERRTRARSVHHQRPRLHTGGRRCSRVPSDAIHALPPPMSLPGRVENLVEHPFNAVDPILVVQIPCHLRQLPAHPA
eukprot:CAMPEP_0173429560 /NCGR_PEP_ID=MMETSP1357-20121228/8221_1 /TAXON_ID=77926 /ORGANISM="Hemiselmis rufescens, Strain PCC563" /LENGTH=130 /DNA_ID=CAMNT_0014393761 /DNA_START=2813 /DNA_END=3205 /DNA_ORIENTATION=+